MEMEQMINLQKLPEQEEEKTSYKRYGRFNENDYGNDKGST